MLNTTSTLTNAKSSKTSAQSNLTHTNLLKANSLEANSMSINSKLASDSNYSNLNSIILAVGTNFPDAMSVTSLAEYTNIPILLTQTETLNQDTQNALKSWGITNVTIIGKEQAVSTNVEDTIKNISISADAENKTSDIATVVSEKTLSGKGESTSVSSISVDRIGGADRYETAKLIGDKLISLLGNEEVSISRTSSNIDNISNGLNEVSIDNALSVSAKTSSNAISQAILVDGTNFPDALTVSSLAGYYKTPILLT
jgi:putative cell wall-binding protein